jgi:antitoxin CptB
MTTPAPLDERRRRALYRAKHRGTKEMDWMLGKYADDLLAAMSDAELMEFEQLMELPEPELQHWLLSGEGYAGSSFAALIERVRAFHGLEQKA